MTDKDELFRMWRRILGIDPTVKEVARFIEPMSEKKALITLRVIFHCLRDSESFREDLIHKRLSETTSLARWAFAGKGRIEQIKVLSNWIIRSGYAKVILRNLYGSLQT